MDCSDDGLDDDLARHVLTTHDRIRWLRVASPEDGTEHWVRGTDIRQLALVPASHTDAGCQLMLRVADDAYRWTAPARDRGALETQVRRLLEAADGLPIGALASGRPRV